MFIDHIFDIHKKYANSLKLFPGVFVSSQPSAVRCLTTRMADKSAMVMCVTAI